MILAIIYNVAARSCLLCLSNMKDNLMPTPEDRESLQGVQKFCKTSGLMPIIDGGAMIDNL
ncbi:hypothetical protein BSZ21_06225 [Bradyrhizobium canariense]|nr:hypothetical protein BSZ21_06225 [Bradyrhizobium canariense]